MKYFESLTLLLCLGQTVAGRKKIAVIGGGIGGASVAYFLRQDFPDADIATFESSSVLGGRLATVEVDGRFYETGGSIIHSANQYMTKFLQICNLQKKQSAPEAPFSLHRDGEIVFQEWGYPLIDKARMALRYGVQSALKLEHFIDNLLQNFGTIYEKLDSGQGFKSVVDLLQEMSPLSKSGSVSSEMEDLTKVSLRDKLIDIGVSEIMVDEIVTVASRVNYGQMPDDLHAFVGSVGLAGMDGALWAVQGGNKEVVKCANMLAKGRGFRARVLEVERKGDMFELTYSFLNQPEKREEFDVVIVATPLTADVSQIKLPGDLSFPGHYHTTVATIVQGDLTPAGAGFKDPADFTTTNFYLSTKSDLVSTSKLSPVDYNPETDSNLPSVFKLFSKREFSSAELSEMFTNISATHSVPWLAYPSYTLTDDLSSFELQPGLYYLNRIEWAASAMEMSAIAARNVANLASNYLKQFRKKDEL